MVGVVRPRILQVFNRYLNPGGEERSVDRIFDHLSADFEMERRLFDSRQWVGPDAPSKFVQAWRMFDNKRSAEILERDISKFRPDGLLVHNVYPVGSPAVYRVAREREVPVIQYIHNFRPFSVGGTLRVNGQNREEALRGNYIPEVVGGAWQDSRLRSALMAGVLLRSRSRGDVKGIKTWISISDFMRQMFVRAGVPPTKIFSLRHSWDTSDRLHGDDTAPAYLLMCRLVEEKGIRVALEAWERIRAAGSARHAPPELWVAGTGPLENEVVRATQGNPSIKYLGYVEGAAKDDLLLRCRAVLAPSTWYEPLGLIAYEAYEYSKPVLAARSGGLEELVVDGVTGLLHRPGDSAELASNVASLEAASAADRRAMGAYGKEWLSSNASVDHWLSRFHEIWEATLS